MSCITCATKLSSRHRNAMGPKYVIAIPRYTLYLPPRCVLRFDIHVILTYRIRACFTSNKYSGTPLIRTPRNDDTAINRTVLALPNTHVCVQLTPEQWRI